MIKYSFLISYSISCLGLCASEVLSIRSLLKNFQVFVGPTLVFCDNHAAVHHATNTNFYERSKYIEIDCHFTRDRVQNGTIRLVFVLVKSAHQLVDILTKALPSPLFWSLLDKLGVIDNFLPT